MNYPVLGYLVLDCSISHVDLQPGDTNIHSKEQLILQQLLREVRKEKRLNQQQLAARLHKPQSFVSKYESGERRLDILELRQICLTLDLTLSEFSNRLETKLMEITHAGE